MAEKQKERLVFVKAVENDNDDWLLDVLGIPFGGPYNGKDSDGEYFDADTELWLNEIGKRAIVHYHGFGQKTPEIVGQEISYEIKSDGVWFRILLDKSKETAKKLWDSAKQNMLRASSGALNHLVRTNWDTGHIDFWPIAELSLMDINAGNYPANPYAVALPALRSVFKAAKLDLPPQVEEETEKPEQQIDPPGETEVKTTMAEEKATKTNVVEKVNELKPLTAEDVLALMEKRDAEKAEQARVAELEAKAARLDELESEVAELKASQTGREQIKKLPHPEADDKEKPPPIEVFSKWDGFTVGQLGLAYSMLKAVNAPSSGTLYRALHAKALKTNLYDEQIKRNERGMIVREFNPNVNSRAMTAVKAIRPMQEAFKSDELHGSDVTDQGDEWVPAYWAPELWDLVRNEARVLSRFRQVEVPGESLTIPTLEGKTTVYKVAQTDDQAELDLPNAAATMTQATTGNVTLTPVKGMAWLGFTEELNEDSILPVLTTMQMVLAMDLAEQLDEIILSGDTDTTNANNSDTGNGSIAATWRLLIANGLRDYALENNKTSEAGALTAEDFTAVMAKLGTNGAYALDPDKLVWFMDPGVYRTALLLGETLTADKAGGIGTFQNGRLQRVFGSDVVVSDKYALTDTNGQIHNTPGNNTKGSFLCVRPDRWVIGFGRQVRIEVPARDLTQIVTDTRHLIASFRFDFKYHSGGNGAALGYNVTV